MRRASRFGRVASLTAGVVVFPSVFPLVSAATAPTSLGSAVLSAPPILWDSAVQSRLVCAMSQDKRGRLWVATEDKGVFARSIRGDWTRFSAKNGLPNDIFTTLAVDAQGRVWLGTARSGVAVYNGRRWKKFGALQGTFGEHIFAIAVCPQNDDVWLATNEGLARWSPKTDVWRAYTKANGLKTEKVQSIAFAKNGDLVLGTQAHGIWIGKAKKSVSGNAKSDIEYSNWRGVTTWDLPGETPLDAGIPSNLINDVLTATDGTIYVATTCGLAWSRDSGATWRYARGRDYADKVRGRVGGAPANWQEKAGAPLLEDYVTALAQDADGRIYLGHRRTPYEVFAPKDGDLGERVWSGDKDVDSPPDYETAILPLNNGQVAVARYGSGLVQSRIAASKSVAEKTDIEYSKPAAARDYNAPFDPDAGFSAFPTPLAAPNLAELNALLAKLALVPREEKNALPVVALSDDWTTRGDWLGRYGRYWANLCAMAPLEYGGDYLWGAGSETIDYQSRIGLGQDKNDSLRYWVTWLHTDNPNSLEMPPVYLHSRVVKGLTTWNVNRRQAENDDHGEEFSPNRDGFGVSVSLRVPAGNFVLSLYDYNKDGDNGDNRFRDYRLSVRRQATGRSLYDISEFAQQPEWARGRLRDFRSGVWKRFLVRGPQQLTIEVNRNFSLNTILAGVMLDELKEKPAPYFRTVEQDRVLDMRLQKSAAARVGEPDAVYAKHFMAATTEAEAATRLFNALDWLRLTNPAWWTTESRRFYLPLTLWYEAQSQTVSPINQVKENDGKTDEARLGTCLYALRLFDGWEKTQRQTGLVPARDVEKSLRWDGRDRDSSSGYDVVSNALNVQKRTSAQTAPRTTRP